MSFLQQKQQNLEDDANYLFSSEDSSRGFGTDTTTAGSSSASEASPKSSRAASTSVRASGTSKHHPTASFTSSRELKFAKNLKLIIVEILRNNPAKGRVILSYLAFVWRKTESQLNRGPSGGSRQCANAGQQPHSYAGGAGSGGANSHGAGNYGNAGGGGGGGNVGNGSGNGGGGGMSGSGGGGGDRNGGGGGFGGSSSGGSGNGNNGNNNNNNNRYYGTKSVPFGTGNGDDQDGKAGSGNNDDGQNELHNLTGLDMDLDFGDLAPPCNATPNWIKDNPDMSGKAIENLLNLKTEFPFSTGNTATPVETKVREFY